MIFPPPIRTESPATTSGNAFAHYSMSVRVPKILEEVSARNPDYPQSVHDSIARLRDDIGAGRPWPPLGFPSPDAGEWQAALDERAGETWLATDWFFAETYVYRCLMMAVRYWENGRDPFAPAKQEELAGAALWHGLHRALEVAPSSDAERIAALLAGALWGNRVDLSYAVGVAFGAAGDSADLLCDDSARAAEQLLRPGGDVHVVTDNMGSELSMDLVLADALLTRAGARVSLHVKMHPTFVSDAVAGDVWSLLAGFSTRGGDEAALGDRLQQAWRDQRLRVLPDPFWNGPRFLWDRPLRLARELDAATAVVLKGDANYRRAVGDALWPAATTFAEATSYLPAPVVALRTLKSDAIVGLPADQISGLDAVDRDWRINGRRGVIQIGGGWGQR